MDEAGFLTDMLGKVGQEGDDVVLHLALDLVDARRIDLALATLPDRLGGLLRHHAQLGQRVGGVRLNLEPDAESVLGRPDGGHGRTGIARNHGLVFIVTEYRGRSIAILPPGLY